MVKDEQIFDSWANHYDADIMRAEARNNWMYKDYTKVLKHVLAVVQQHIPQTGILVLDIGAGTGNLTKYFHETKYRIIAVEPSQQMINKFAEKFPAVPILKGGFCSIPFPDHAVDAIVSSYAWHHLTPEEKQVSINEMSRVLKEDGAIIIADLMFKDQEERARVLDDFKNQGKTGIIKDIESEHYADISHISSFFKAKGFSFQSIQMTDFVWIIHAAAT
jgi:ubiquinone/menaquinone biosynthesis C-methylase UbiE